MRTSLRTVALCLAATALCTATGKPDFDKDILPILRTNCLGCHGGMNPQAGLDLRTAESILKGGKSGAAIRPGAGDQSLLVEKIAAKSMPPVGNKLSPEQIALIKNWVDQQSASMRVVTENDVIPIFQMRCVVCHGKRKQEGGLDLRFQASRLKGGKSGPALVPRKPDESLLLQRVLKGEMPPPKLLVEYFVRPPNNEEVETLRQWIAGGALPAPKEAAEPQVDPLVTDKDRSFWSFQPPKRPAVPSVHR